jgi:hypothetical protein
VRAWLLAPLAVAVGAATHVLWLGAVLAVALLMGAVVREPEPAAGAGFPTLVVVSAAWHIALTHQATTTPRQ